jgi:hypothetical protein
MRDFLLLFFFLLVVDRRVQTLLGLSWWNRSLIRQEAIPRIGESDLYISGVCGSVVTTAGQFYYYFQSLFVLTLTGLLLKTSRHSGDARSYFVEIYI